MTALVTTQFTFEGSRSSSAFLLRKGDASLGYISKVSCVLQKHSKRSDTSCITYNDQLACNRFSTRFLDLTENLGPLNAIPVY